MTTRAAVYLRQSLDVHEGIERQRQRCAALVVARGWVLAGEYADNDTSASKARGTGTGWARMLGDASAGRFDVVVAVDLDRLLRTVRDLVTLTDTGAKVLTVDGEIDLTTADGEFRATMLAGIARFEARRKGERQTRANEHRARQGQLRPSRRPFGFEQDGVTIREREASAIRDGYAAVLSGLPLAEIARQWNAAGHTTGQKRQARSGHAGEPSPWRADAVRTVLLNPRNMGKRAYRGEIVADSEWSPIVDEATWRATEAVLRNPARRRAGRAPQHLLTAIGRCGVCGSPIHSGANSRRGIRSYRCRASLGHFSRKAEPVEEFVSAVVVARLSQPDAIDLLTDRQRPDVSALRDEANGYRQRLDALAVEFADGLLTASQLRAATERLRERLQDVEGRLADAGRVDVLGPLVTAPDVRTAWDGLSVARQRAAIDALMTVTLLPPGRGSRTFRPETVRIEWKTS